MYVRVVWKPNPGHRLLLARRDKERRALSWVLEEEWGLVVKHREDHFKS
jgi:hypothetical protein